MPTIAESLLKALALSRQDLVVAVEDMLAFQEHLPSWRA
jgi:hypothetical protein